ncbi:GumC family protein [Teichococcus coralli]|uniref:GumC family protein n=1 Tax=Teichococcus coralli TaxID=2545983 RepID=UPI001368D58F
MQPVASLPSPREVVAVAFRHRRWILLAALLPVLLGATLPFVLTPIYEARTRVLVRGGREFTPQVDAPGMLQSPQTTMREMVDTVIQILQSVDLFRDVVGDVSVQKLYPRLAEESSQGLTPENAAILALGRDISAAPVRLTNVIEISLRNPDAQVAVQGLETVLTRFQERYVRAFSQRRSALLETQIEENQRYLTEVQSERAAYMASHELYSLTDQRSLLVQRHGREREALRAVEMRKSLLEEQIRFLASELERQPPTITVQTTSQDSPLATDALRRLRELQEREREMLRTLGSEHPNVRGIRAAIQTTQQVIAQTNARTTAISLGINPLVTTLKTQLASAEAELAPLAGQVLAYGRSLATEEARLRQIGLDEIQLQTYDRSIAQVEGAIRELRQRQTDARFNEELDRAQVAGLSVIEQPQASDRPIAPKKMLFLAGGIVAGGIMSCFALLVAMTFGRRFLTTETAERMLGVPVLVTLPPMAGLAGRRQMLEASAEEVPPAGIEARA